MVEQSSGYSALDLNALRAVVITRQLPALPDAFPNPTLPVHLNFQYIR
jgi:outer membrane biosynthesis protein TonB